MAAKTNTKTKAKSKTESRWTAPQDWEDWTDWLAAGLHGRNRHRLPVLLLGMIFASGRKTVTAWLRAAGVSDDYRSYYYFLARLGSKTEVVATALFTLVLRTLPLPERVLLAIDDSPTKRYGPKVEGAGVHRHPSAGPAGESFLYGHVWVTLSLVVRHPVWGTLGLPLRAFLYVRKKTLEKLPESRRPGLFATKLQLAVRLLGWAVKILNAAGKRVWIAVDGGYVKKVFLDAAKRLNAIVVGRLRVDAALRDVPRPPRRGQRRRGRPRIYGENKISLAKRAAARGGWEWVTCTVYGKTTSKKCKTFLATYRPAGGLIRVVIIQETDRWIPLCCTSTEATVQEIIEAFADRGAIEQDFHDLKEVWGAGEQQVRNLWSNVAVFNMALWARTLLTMWSWHRSAEELVDRSASPWDDGARRPSHADCRKAMRRKLLDEAFSRHQQGEPLPPEILELARTLLDLAA